MALCAEQALKYTPRALHYQLSMKWLMFNSMFALAAVEFASKLIANFESNTLSGERTPRLFMLPAAICRTTRCLLIELEICL